MVIGNLTVTRERYAKEHRELVCAEHYSRSAPRVIIRCYAMRLGPELCGVALVTTIPLGTLTNIDPQRGVHLSRLAIKRGVHRNACSMMLVINDLRASGLYDALLSYADTSEMHSGAIYRASNFAYLGLSTPTYHWIKQDGSRGQLRTGKQTLTRLQAEARGWKREGPLAKHKYVYCLRSDKACIKARARREACEHCR